MSLTNTLRRPDDRHLYLRDGELLETVLRHTTNQFAAAMVMPSLKSPMMTVMSARAYRIGFMLRRPRRTVQTIDDRLPLRCYACGRTTSWFRNRALTKRPCAMREAAPMIGFISSPIFSFSIYMAKNEMNASSKEFRSSIDYAALGDRLRAYRIGASLLAEDVAEQLGISRAVVYRLEKGEIVKIETLERLAHLLGTSVASLLGVEVEYYSSALGLFERMRQLEESSDRILAHFEPISLLLTSDDYLPYLREMLLEASPRGAGKGPKASDVDKMLKIMIERKAFFEKRRPHIVSLIGLRELERFVHTGLVGRVDLPDKVRLERVQAARREVARIADLMESEPIHVQIGLIDDAMPASTFQVFSGPKHSVLAVSPFRLGELPNVRNGIATVTASPEAVRMYEDMVARLWRGAYKGKTGAQSLRKLLDRIH